MARAGRHTLCAIHQLIVLAGALLGAARAQNCTSLPGLVNGRYVSCSRTPGSVCTAQCNTGYTSRPAPSITCVAGTWTPAVSQTCSRVCRGAPAAVANVAWGAASNDFCNGSVPLGGTCVGSCTGAAPFGSIAVTCNPADGTWSLPPLGACTTTAAAASAACNSDPPVIADGSWEQGCYGRLNGSVCTLTCKRSAVTSATWGASDGSGPSGITSRCVNGLWSQPAAKCVRVCPGLPSANVSNTQQGWPASCAFAVAGSSCAASCAAPGFDGRPTVRCLSTGWDSNVLGGCSSTSGGPVCKSLPPQLLNGAWSSSCLDTPAGGQCWAVCNNNDAYSYAAKGTPMATCGTNGQWSVWGQCAQGPPLPPRKAFFIALAADQATGLINICDVVDAAGVLSGCVQNDGKTPASAAFPVSPASVFATQDTVWIPMISTVYVCSWSPATNRLLNCTEQGLPPSVPFNLTSGGFIDVAVDEATNTAYLSNTFKCLVVCPNAKNLSTCSCSPGIPVSPEQNFWGIKLLSNQLWVSMSGDERFWQCAVSGPTVGPCKQHAFPYGNGPNPFAIDSSRGVAWVGDNKGKLYQCDATTFDAASCVPRSPLGRVGYGSFTMAVHLGTLFVPIMPNPANVTVNNNTIYTCTSPGTCYNQPAGVPFPYGAFIYPYLK